MLTTEQERRGNVVVVRAEGDIDEDGVKTLRVALANVIREKEYDVVVNLEGVRLISYMGIGVLVEQLRQFRCFAGDMKLTGLNLYAERLFRMVGVTSLFQIFETEDEAVRVYQEAA